MLNAELKSPDVVKFQTPEVTLAVKRYIAEAEKLPLIINLNSTDIIIPAIRTDHSILLTAASTKYNPRSFHDLGPNYLWFLSPIKYLPVKYNFGRPYNQSSGTLTGDLSCQVISNGKKSTSCVRLVPTNKWTFSIVVPPLG